ncbi:MAG: hypothetical protein DRI91_05420 [Aquificota bacterium]|nr:MAG: hypothetical protein DRI91_05420 [Aquificota bacterium]
MRVEELLEEWTVHYLGGMGLRLYRVKLEEGGVRFILGWRGEEVVEVRYSPMDEETMARLEVIYVPGRLPRGVEEGLFRAMRVLLPPRGKIGHRMEVKELEEHLKRGIPLALTPWGLLVWLAGGRRLTWTEDAVWGEVPLKKDVGEEELGEMIEFVEAYRESRDPYVVSALDRWETIEWELG